MASVPNEPNPPSPSSGEAIPDDSASSPLNSEAIGPVKQPEIDPIPVNTAPDPLPESASTDTPPANNSPVPSTGSTLTFENIARTSSTAKSGAAESSAPGSSAAKGSAPKSSAPESRVPAEDSQEAIAPTSGLKASKSTDSESPNKRPAASETQSEARAEATAGEAPTPEPATPASTPTTAPSRTPAEPVASGGTVQRIWGLAQPILATAATASLSTAIKGTNWLTERLEVASPVDESNQTGALAIIAGVWKVVRPLLVAVTLSLSRLFNQVLQWSLARVNPEAKASAAAESSRTAFLITTAVLGLLAFLISTLISPAPTAAKSPVGPVTQVTPAAPTPSQARLEAVQAQVVEVVDSYDGFVDAIDVNLAGDRIAVTLDDGWYRLTDKDRQQLARRLQRQASELDFPKLTLFNARQERIARTPVVGARRGFLQTPEPPTPEVPTPRENPPPPARAAPPSPPANPIPAPG
ncbi:MAG: hypothetical protein ACFB5Z_12355, partial [Elainellaceae cyanobacterium]